jgi:hypothetical protein
MNEQKKIQGRKKEKEKNGFPALKPLYLFCFDTVFWLYDWSQKLQMP